MTDSTLSVLHIASGDLWAGAEVQLYMLARAQRQLGADVRVALLNPGTLADRLTAEGIPVHLFPEATTSAPRLLWQLFRLVRKTRPSVVHTHRLKENLLGGLAAWLNRVPSVRTQHGAPEFHYGWRQWHKKLLHAADRLVGLHLQSRVIAVTPELGGKLRAQFPLPHITVIENGIDPDAFTRFPPGQDFLPAFASAERRVGIVGRLVPVKRVDLFIETARLLARDPALQDVEFFVIGDGPLRATLQGKAQDLQNRLHFLGALETVHPYIEALDVLVMCSDHEGLPMTLLEAMALGTPVVGHETGGIALLASQGRGLVTPRHQAHDYAQLVAQALAEEEDSQAMADAAREYVMLHHHAGINAERCLRLYSQLGNHE